MNYLTLEEIKKQCNIDEQFTDDDLYLEQLGTVSEVVVEKRLDVNLADIIGENGELPSPLHQCMLLYVGHLYANREATTNLNVKELPLGFEYLISMYANYTYK